MTWNWIGQRTVAALVAATSVLAIAGLAIRQCDQERQILELRGAASATLPEPPSLPPGPPITTNEHSNREPARPLQKIPVQWTEVTDMNTTLSLSGYVLERGGTPVADGKFVERSASGVVVTEGEFLEGDLNGILRSFDMAGRLRLSCQYVRGKCCGTVNEYDERGNLTAVGTWIAKDVRDGEWLVWKPWFEGLEMGIGPGAPAGVSLVVTVTLRDKSKQVMTVSEALRSGRALVAVRQQWSNGMMTSERCALFDALRSVVGSKPATTRKFKGTDFNDVPTPLEFAGTANSAIKETLARVSIAGGQRELTLVPAREDESVSYPSYAISAFLEQIKPK